MKAKRRLAKFLVIILIVCAGICYAITPRKAKYFTTQKHVERITEKIKKNNEAWMYDEGKRYEDFTVYPLYNEKEEVKYCLVEFEPYGFMFVLIHDEPPRIMALFELIIGMKVSMYTRSYLYGRMNPWSPYIPSNTDGGKNEEEQEWILDGNGERIFYEKSPYFVSGNINEKKYLIKIKEKHSFFVCAVKKGEKFINLVSGEEFKDTTILTKDEQAFMKVYCLNANHCKL